MEAITMAGTTRRKPGWMGMHIEGLRTWLLERGYTLGSIKLILTLAGQLGRWMQTADVKSRSSSISPPVVLAPKFLDVREALGRRSRTPPRVGSVAIVQASPRDDLRDQTHTVILPTASPSAR
jgi:hypothetical protein